MAMTYVDVHPHIVSPDESRYPRMPLFGVQSDWSKTRPVTIEQMVEVMDEAGVHKAAIVQAATCYGYDNSYLADSVQRYPGRFTGVGSVDFLAADAAEKIRAWYDRGITGLRLFTGGSTKEIDADWLVDPASFPAWECASAMKIPVVIQTDPSGLGHVAALATRFPDAFILLDHCARPTINDGPPYAKAASLFAMAQYKNIRIKVTPRTFDKVREGKADAETFFAKLVGAFGASRLAWGSNFPASDGKMSTNLEVGKQCLASLSETDRAWIFGRTAMSLYPALAAK